MTRGAVVRVVLATGLALGASVALAGCDLDPGPDCFPAPLELSESTVAPGDSVTVSAAAVTCEIDRRYREYAVHLGTGIDTPDPARESQAPDADVVARVRVGADGSFSTTFDVPTAAPEGAAVVYVSGSRFDYCPDPNADCAGYTTRVIVRG